VSKAATAVLDRLGWSPDRGAVGAAYWIARGMWDECVKIGAPAVEPLITALEKGGWASMGAIAALARIGDVRAVEPLSGALGDQDENVRKAAAEALDRLAWSPDRGAAGAAYWAVRGEWDKCVQIGAPAVEPLIAALTGGSWDVRWPAAEGLVAIYQSGKLDETQKAKLLAQRDVITGEHHDHEDSSYSCVFHTDGHTDEGIGIAFPV
jgi:HEAT repeat protein